MNILLSRILTYLNGTLFHDYYYKICNFIIFNYLDIEDMDEEEFLNKGAFKKEELYSFMKLLGFNDYISFKETLVLDHQKRANQIKVRMLGIQGNKLLNNMEKSCSDEEMMKMIEELCKKIYKANRIVIFGALYPLSISIELQTDMITFGKPFIQYHDYDPLTLNENDVAIVISATGRYLEGFRKTKEEVKIDNASTYLITQNKKYLKTESSNNCSVIYLPGKYDSIDFNYQVMTLCDLIRLQYFKQYYL